MLGGAHCSNFSMRFQADVDAVVVTFGSISIFFEFGGIMLRVVCRTVLKDVLAFVFRADVSYPGDLFCMLSQARGRRARPISRCNAGTNDRR